MSEKTCVVCESKFFAKTCSLTCSPVCRSAAHRTYQRSWDAANRKPRIRGDSKRCRICGGSLPKFRSSICGDACAKKADNVRNRARYRIQPKKCNEAGKRWRQKNKEKIAAYTKAKRANYTKEERLKCAAYSRRYYWENKEKCDQKAVQRYWQNPIYRETMSQRARQRYWRNKALLDAAKQILQGQLT